MKALIQRVKSAQVKVDTKQVSSIGPGILTFLGVEKDDTKQHIEKAMSKISELRIFSDEEGKFNHSILDVKYEHLIVSQFTLAGDCSRGRRPSFHRAAPPKIAEELYNYAIHYSQSLGLPTQGGQFQAMMDVGLINDGPVTFWLEF